MKKCLFFIFLLIFIFNVCSVNAWNGIKSISNINFIPRPDSNAQFIMPGYNSKVVFDDGTSKNAATFCLDSTEKTPSSINSSNSNILQLDDPNRSNMYAGFYGAYQSFYDMVKNDSANITKYKAYLEAASRVYLKYIGEENKSYNKYPSYDSCKNAIINGDNKTNRNCFGSDNTYYWGINTLFQNAKATKEIMGNIRFYNPEVKIEKQEEGDFIIYNISFELYGDLYSKEKYPSISLGSGSGSISEPSVKFKDILIYSNDVAMSLDGLKTEGSIVDYNVVLISGIE